MFFNVTSTTGSADCIGTKLYLKYDCGGCFPAYPWQSGSKVIASQYKVLDYVTAFEIGEMTDPTTDCNCNITFGNVTWFMMFDNSNVAENCSYDVNIQYQCTGKIVDYY
jgi:hypothetical protein